MSLILFSSKNYQFVCKRGQVDPRIHTSNIEYNNNTVILYWNSYEDLRSKTQLLVANMACLVLMYSTFVHALSQDNMTVWILRFIQLALKRGFQFLRKSVIKC